MVVTSIDSIPKSKLQKYTDNHRYIFKQKQLHSNYRSVKSCWLCLESILKSNPRNFVTSISLRLTANDGHPEEMMRRSMQMGLLTPGIGQPINGIIWDTLEVASKIWNMLKWSSFWKGVFGGFLFLFLIFFGGCYNMFFWTWILLDICLDFFMGIPVENVPFRKAPEIRVLSDVDGV